MMYSYFILEISFANNNTHIYWQKAKNVSFVLGMIITYTFQFF